MKFSNAALTLVVVLSAACTEPDEAPSIDQPVLVDSSGIVVSTNDLGYEVEVSNIRVAVSDLLLTVAGESHTASL